MPKAEMTKYTIVDYISDMYSAPAAVNAYLCRQKGLHQVPVFREENNHSGDLKFKFHNYYIGNQKFNTRKSKYSGMLSTGMEDIAGRQVIRLAAVVDTQEVERVAADLEAKNKVIINNSARLANFKRNCDNIRNEVNKLNEEINKLRSVKKEFSHKQSELDMKRRTLEQMKEPVLNIDARKREITAEKKKVVLKLAKLTSVHADLAKKSVDAETRRRLLHLSFQNIESENSEKLAGLNRELETAQAQYKEIQKVWDKDKKALQERHSEARKATGILSDDIKYKPPEDWQRKFDELGSSDEAVLGAYLDECISELKHMKKIPDQTIADIETLKEKLTNARNDKESLEKEIANKRHEAKKLKMKWMNGVQELVENVNDKFGSMMADLGYNGEISLSQGKDDIDFSSYGIKIQVRFRQGQELQDLSKGTQSGGEKSVSTAVYMMALQELTQVPFRCVDEINQGMDEKNERAVWGMLLEVCRRHQAQYFYMAPKFPNKLPFNRQVTMLICNNGNVGSKSSHKDYRTSKFLESARKRRRR